MDDHGAAKHQLLMLWEVKRGERQMPAREDFDVLADLRPFLGHLILAELVDGGRDYWFRIFGTRISAVLGEEHHGMRLSDLPPSRARRAALMFNRVARSRTPAGFVHSGIRDHLIERFESLMLPLSDDGERVNMILSLMLPILTQISPSADGQ